MKFLSTAIAHDNCFVNKQNDQKIWNLDFNIRQSDQWEPALTSKQAQWLESIPKNTGVMHSPGIPRFNAIQFVSVDQAFLENYEKLLTCFLASKIESKRSKYAFKRKQERKEMMRRLFELEIGKQEMESEPDANKENQDAEQTIDDQKKPGRDRKMKGSMILEKKPSQIPRGTRSGKFARESGRREKMFQERRRQLNAEIEDLFEVEGRTLWNYSASVKIQEGLLTDLENLFRSVKHQSAPYSSKYEDYLASVEELKQSIEVG